MDIGIYRKNQNYSCLILIIFNPILFQRTQLKSIISMPANILFIMCDQLRYDYLSCYGHRNLLTPNIDKLAARGVTFTNAYCQAPLCAPSRASFYSGRYQSSHGVMSNEDATGMGENMIADYLRASGYRSAVVGKTHSFKRFSDFEEYGIDTNSDLANSFASGGFEPYEHHEGIYPDPVLPAENGYNDYLKGQGYNSDNPWERCANSSVDSNGNRHSGWHLRSSKYPAVIKEEHSETAFCTKRAMEFIDETGDQPWCLHLSYIKPHWPVIAAAPYHDMYGVDDIQAFVGDERERENPHPVYQAFMQQEYSESYAREDIRDVVIPAYMGLVKQIDDHLGRLFEFMEARQLFDHTLVVFTADHGDYLGDHWLGEKDLFHEPSAKIPLIVVDPRAAANVTRGTQIDEFVEAVDILPSFIDFAGATSCCERLEGRSLTPLLHQHKEINWRDYAISEIDFSDRGARVILGLEPFQCRAIMVRNQRWKYIYHYAFEAQLFDMLNDPQELIDLGRNPQYQQTCAQMNKLMNEWRDNLKRRTGISYDEMIKQGPELDEEFGIIIGRV